MRKIAFLSIVFFVFLLRAYSQNPFEVFMQDYEAMLNSYMDSHNTIADRNTLKREIISWYEDKEEAIVFSDLRGNGTEYITIKEYLENLYADYSSGVELRFGEYNVDFDLDKSIAEIKTHLVVNGVKKPNIILLIDVYNYSQDQVLGKIMAVKGHLDKEINGSFSTENNQIDPKENIDVNTINTGDKLKEWIVSFDANNFEIEDITSTGFVFFTENEQESGFIFNYDEGKINKIDISPSFLSIQGTPAINAQGDMLFNNITDESIYCYFQKNKSLKKLEVPYEIATEWCNEKVISHFRDGSVIYNQEGVIVERFDYFNDTDCSIIGNYYLLSDKNVILNNQGEVALDLNQIEINNLTMEVSIVNQFAMISYMRKIETAYEHVPGKWGRIHVEELDYKVFNLRTKKYMNFRKMPNERITYLGDYILIENESIIGIKRRMEY